MPRQARGKILAGSYHITHRTTGPIRMFIDDIDRTLFCNYLAGVIKAQGWICHAFCLMPTHYHLLLDVDEDALQPGMQRLNGPYAQRFNGRHGRRGHLRGDRYSAKPVESIGHMLHTYRYIARNPVRAGLCACPSDWTWGSYRGSVGLEVVFPFVDSSRIHGYFGADRATGFDTLREFCGDLTTRS